MAQIAWRIQWRGKEWAVRWEDGALSGGAAAEAFGRFVVSNAPDTEIPREQRLSSAAALRELMPQFADAVLQEDEGHPDETSDSREEP